VSATAAKSVGSYLLGPPEHRPAQETRNMTKHLIASFVAIGLLAGPAAAATNTKAPTEKAKVHKAHMKAKTNVKDDQSKTKTK
jgi:hypothetical protein